MDMDTTKLGEGIAWAGIFFVVVLVTTVIGSYVFMACWNESIPHVFGLPSLSHRQSLHLLLALWLASAVWQKTNINAKVRISK